MMELTVILQNKIIDFLKSLPNLDDIRSRQAFIFSVGLDSQLYDQIPFDETPAQFAPLLVSRLLKYGKLNDGRHAIEAVLETAKHYIGQDKQAYCNSLIKELHTIDISQSQSLNSSSHNDDKENVQRAIGSYIAQADHGSTATITINKSK